MEEPTQPIAQPEPQPEVAEPVAEAAAGVAEPAPEPAPEVPIDPKQAFLDGYNELVEKTGFNFSVEPKFKQNPDGSYDTTIVSIQTTIIPKAK